MMAISQGDKNRLNICELFENQANISPNIIAIRNNQKIVTYSELKEKVISIANGINTQISSNETRFIGVCMIPCINTIATIFAILKAGFAYIPIDPAYPAERINYIINDAKLSLVITNEETISKLRGEDKYQLIDSKYLTCLEHFPKEKSGIEQNHLHTDLAYVIYTSGSTGNPKGVMVSHQNVKNYARWVKDYLQLSRSETFDCSSSFSFDLTVTVSIVPLLYGSTVVICDEKTKKSPAEYLRYLQENKITIIKTTPSYFNLLCDFIDDFNLLSIKKIILGGENLSFKHVKKWLLKYQDHEIINEYGPTETTVGVTKAIINKDNIHAIEYIPLGSPILNAELKVLNAEYKPVSKGEIGELYVAGNCVTKGYLNREQLTKEKFVLLESGDPSKLVTMYKTGDLVRFHGSPEQLEYIGRTDEQIKLRGYRIELGEIENQLLKFNGVKLAATLHRKSGEHDDLLAYYVPERNAVISKSALKDFLQSALPEYMLPSIYIELKEANLTVNGKLDKASLPDVNAIRTKQEYSPSVSVSLTTSLQLKNIWSNLVSLDEIDLSANFFDMGGNSLTLARFCKRLKDKGLKVELTDLFQHPTIESLANHIDQPSKEENLELPYQPRRQRNYAFQKRKVIVSRSLQQGCC